VIDVQGACRQKSGRRFRQNTRRVFRLCAWPHRLGAPGRIWTHDPALAPCWPLQRPSVPTKVRTHVSPAVGLRTRIRQNSRVPPSPTQVFDRY